MMPPYTLTTIQVTFLAMQLVAVRPLILEVVIVPATVEAASSNMALNPVRFALWTLRDKAAQRRLALR